jgi:hypothetical protein
MSRPGGPFFRALARRIGLPVQPPERESEEEEPTIPADDLPRSVNERTVVAMLDNLRRLVASEEQRLNSLTTRGSGLAGFAGLATAVIVAGDDGGIPLASKILLTVSVAVLVLAAGGVVLKILPPRKTTIQSLDELRLYRATLYQSVSPARVEVQIIDILITRLERLRNQNKARAEWLNFSARALVTAVLLAATAAVVRFFA